MFVVGRMEDGFHPGFKMISSGFNDGTETFKLSCVWEVWRRIFKTQVFKDGADFFSQN